MNFEKLFEGGLGLALITGAAASEAATLGISTEVSIPIILLGSALVADAAGVKL